MEERSLIEVAEENVSRHHPPPTMDATHAGILGAVAFGVAASIFAAAARLDIAEFAGSIVVTIAIGFCVPFFYLRSQHQKHSELVLRERERLAAAAETTPR